MRLDAIALVTTLNGPAPIETVMNSGVPCALFNNQEKRIMYDTIVGTRLFAPLRTIVFQNKETIRASADTMVLCPSRWAKIEDLRTGDMVFVNTKSQRVTQVQQDVLSQAVQVSSTSDLGIVVNGVVAR